MHFRHRNFVLVLLTLYAASFFAGCSLQPGWRLAAHKKGDTVQLCLSHELACPQPGGVTLDDIAVYQYDSTAANNLIWEAAAPESQMGESTIDGTVAYGVPPAGWHNKLGPPQLVCGKAYLVNPGAHLFGLKCDGTVVVLDFPDLEAYFAQAASEAAKNRTNH